MAKLRRAIAIVLTMVMLLTSMTVKVEAKTKYGIRETIVEEERCIEPSAEEMENQQQLEELISTIVTTLIAIGIALIGLIIIGILNVLIGVENVNN